MKKINYRKLTAIVLWFFAIAGLTISLAFVSKSERNVKVKNLDIKIFNNEENLFLTETDINNFLIEKDQSLLNKEFGSVRMPQLEKILNSHPAVQNAEVSADINGEVKISVLQRTPVCRIMNTDGESYYIDSQSKLMPLSDNYSARVIVVSGNISEPFARRYQYSVDQIKASKAFSEVSILDDVLAVVNHINADSTLSALIQQVYINDNKEMELFPAIGNHKIIFGSAEDVNVKFNKLKFFYTEGLNKSDAWTKYSTINLKYKNLVVCTKK